MSTAARMADRSTRLSGRPFLALAGAVVLLGLADSLVGAYFVLYLADVAALDPVQIGLLWSLPAIGGIAFSLWAGRRFDVRPTRTWAVVAAASSAVGYALLTTTTSFAWLLLISVVFFAAYQAAYPQLFSMARVVLGDGDAGRRAAPLLRSGWSLSWAVGPLAGAVLVPLVGFEGVLWTAVLLLALVLPALAAVPSLRPAGSLPAAVPSSSSEDPGDDDERQTPGLPRRSVVLLTGSVAVFWTAVFAGSIALPLHAVRGMGQPEALVGGMYGLCAAVEVVAALVLAALPARVSRRALVAVGMVALAGHFALVVAADGPLLLLASQVPRGVAIAVVGAVGIGFFQDAMAPRTGFATTLFSAATDAGLVLSGIAGGVAVQLFGAVPALGACGAAALVGAGLFLAGGASRRQEPVAPEC